MTSLPRRRAFTEIDLAAMPDDGNRYELVDGALIVTPSLVTLHQIVGGELHLALRAACPDIAVEVLSPSTRQIDLGLKRSRYEAAGCASHWVADPDLPSISAWELGDGGDVVAGVATGAEPLTLHHPFEVTVVPATLVT